MKIPDIIEKLRVLAPVDWNEETTKLRAVLPILNALGWLNFDMDSEVWIGRGKTKFKLDIRLSTSNHPVIIECKKPAVDLDRAIGQMVEYAYHEGARLAALTNGFRWDLYLPYTDKGKPRESRFASIDLLSDSTPSALCDELMLFLERNAVESGKALSSAEERLEVKRRGEQIQDALPAVWQGMLAKPPDILLNLIADEVRQRIGHNPTNHQVREFISKHDVFPSEPMASTSAEQHQMREQQYVSTVKQLPNSIQAFVLWGQRTEVSTWVELILGVASKLYQRHGENFSRAADMFVWIKLSDSDMRAPRSIPNSPYFIETHQGAPGLANRSRRLLEIFGYSKSDLIIESSDSVAPSVRHETVRQQYSSPGRQPKKPIRAFSLWNQRTEVTTWASLLFEVSVMVYRRHRSDFARVTNEVNWIARSASRMLTPRQIPNSPYYINIHGGAPGLERRARQLLNIFGYSPLDLIIDSSDSITQPIQRDSRAQRNFSADMGRASAASISAFELWGQRTAVTSWVELLIGVAAIMYQRHGNDFDYMAKQVSWLSRNSNLLNSPHKVPGSPFYVNSYAGAKALEARCRKLLKIFGHSPDDLQIIE
ncbi:MAG: type I restriction enzyme HsdR N-terminal domain-containing protein [Deltaproteobacteria bacterium]|nr:type I restriction enzyme HsdR N-terminal domain-containing protein [Deltaproteobacteria bacterium]MDD9873108.1 type I restriction enzyme HsdR N-terminal domain-containing protein [Deltaproteobacteria bacterium]